VEGDSDDPAVEALRNRQLRNFAALLLLSRGVPMFTAGDEVRRTQHGNNNAYCQDNEISWFDWTLVEKNRGLHRFWKRMIEFRKAHKTLRSRQFFTGAEVTWHGTKLESPGWSDPEARALALTLAGEPCLHVMFNMHWDSLEFELPNRLWKKAVDTAQPSPNDIPDAGAEPEVTTATLTVQPRSVVVLVGSASAAP
jgi:glycogen operon protein